METRNQTLQVVKDLINIGISADYLFPTYNYATGDYGNRFIICVHSFNLETALKFYPNAKIIASE